MHSINKPNSSITQCCNDLYTLPCPPSAGENACQMHGKYWRCLKHQALLQQADLYTQCCSSWALSLPEHVSWLVFKQRLEHGPSWPETSVSSDLHGWTRGSWQNAPCGSHVLFTSAIGGSVTSAMVCIIYSRLPENAFKVDSHSWNWPPEGASTA